MEIKLEINKDLECKQLLIQKLEGNYTRENWCIIYLIMLKVKIEIMMKMIVKLVNKK